MWSKRPARLAFTWMRDNRNFTLCLALLGLAANGARADRAVVVGVQQYPNLPERANQLQGCVNDAKAMKAALERYRFAVTLLVNEEATKRGILAALKKEAGLIKPNERFVFYFAGHGTDAPKPSLLPQDALDGRDINHLTRDELYNAVAAVPAHSRTVVLDSCFSDGMTRSLEQLERKRPSAQARYYYSNRRERSPVPVNNQDTNQNIAGAGGSSGEVCYYVAALGNEKAMEENFNGAHHGVFTYFLTSQLDGERELWKNIHTAVKGKVVDYLFDWQHPTLSPAPYLQAPVFEAENKQPATPVITTSPTAWNTYNSDNPDPERISLTMEPNKTTVTQGEKFRFAAQIGDHGFLVVLDRDVKGKVTVLFPKSRRVEEAQVRAGQVVRLPENSAQEYTPDTPGPEHLKAILFSSRDKAAALLAALEKGGSGLSLKGMKALPEVPVKDAAFYTSEIVFEVAEK